MTMKSSKFGPKFKNSLFFSLLAREFKAVAADPRYRRDAGGWRDRAAGARTTRRRGRVRRDIDSADAPFLLAASTVVADLERMFVPNCAACGQLAIRGCRQKEEE